MADPVITASLIESLRRHRLHSKDIAEALVELRASFEREGIPFAVIGALAMQQYGYVRHTEDIDIVTTPEGLARIHERLVGRGIVPRGPGLRKKLRLAARKVDLDVLQAGEHAGSPESPVVYPSPDSAEFDVEGAGIRYATLPALMSFKIASGLWGRRPRDLADAQELIKVNKLSPEFAAELPEPLREEFRRLVEAARSERDIE
jgi:hypothetical protein